MDLGTGLLGAAFIAIATLPFVVVNNGKRKIKNRQLFVFKREASNLHCDNIDYETCGDYIIGIDLSKQLLLFNNRSIDLEKVQVIDLKKIKNCEINTVSRTVGTGKNKTKVIDRLELHLSSKDGRTENILTFYSDDHRDMFSGELKSIEKWAGTIKKDLTK